MIAAGTGSMGRAASPASGAQPSRWPRAVARLRLALSSSEAAAGSGGGRWTACFRPAPSPAAAGTAAVKEAKGKPPEVEVEPARGGGEDVWSAGADAEVAQGGGFPEHLVIMVNGLVGRWIRGRCSLVGCPGLRVLVWRGLSFAPVVVLQRGRLEVRSGAVREADAGQGDRAP